MMSRNLVLVRILFCLFCRGKDYQVDQLVLTHLDQDHSGAYFSIQDQLAIKSLYASEHVAVPNATQFEYCQQGQVWQWENVHIEVLSPNNIQAVRAGAERNETHVCCTFE